jgi:hypothetical protein
MTAKKITYLFISVFILGLLSTCRQKAGRPIDLDLIRIDPEKILVADSTGMKIVPRSPGFKESFKIDTISKGVYHLKITFSSDRLRRIRNLEIPLQFMHDSAAIREEVRNYFHWVPNLKKNPEDVISQHVFRSPAIILTRKQSAVSVIPDLNSMKTYSETPYYLDLKFGDNGTVISYGLDNYKVRQHVYYERSDSSFVLPENIELGLYIISSENSSSLDILKNTNAFLWNTFGKDYFDSLSPQVVTFRHYAEVGYAMALSKYWVNGNKPGTGGITLSTYLDKATGIYRGRDYKDDLWFHSWFNNARTAYGLYLWGEESGKELWKDKAISTMNLLLSSPQINGFFPTIWVPEKSGWIASGQGGGPDLYHVPDNAWTAIWLLRFSDELKELHGADNFLTDFVKGLIETQLENGSFPERLRVSDLSPDPVLKNSASGSMATWFLEEMILRKKLTPDVEEKARVAVKRSLSFLEEEILPVRRFQDFEVFFSCAPNTLNHFDSLTWLYPHNTLSIQWSAEAFLKAYQLFKRKHDLDQGEYCLNLLSLYQQVWSPSFIDFYAFGGFGAQNTDAEWSDARQAQFAETYLNYFLATGNIEYLQRSIAACRASFALMAIPENKTISPHNYEGTSYNGEYIGAMAENFGHSGYNERSGQSGFHWGTGSALTTAAIFKAKLGDIYIDSRSHIATGIDGVVVEETHWRDTIRLATKRLANLKDLKIYSDQDEDIGKKVLLDKDQHFITVATYRK